MAKGDVEISAHGIARAALAGVVVIAVTSLWGEGHRGTRAMLFALLFIVAYVLMRGANRAKSRG